MAGFPKGTVLKSTRLVEKEELISLERALMDMHDADQAVDHGELEWAKFFIGEAQKKLVAFLFGEKPEESEN